MQTFINFFNILLSLGTFLYIVLIFGISFLIFKKDPKVKAFFARYGLKIIFSVSLIATVSSLIYSNYIGFPPCDLCWYQRIAMYPTVFISGLALYKKQDPSVLAPYMSLLVGVGGFISLFHNFIYYTNINPFPCSATASCTARYVYEFGFVTIPLMALLSFISLFIVLKSIKK